MTKTEAERSSGQIVGQGHGSSGSMVNKGTAGRHHLSGFVWFCLVLSGFVATFSRAPGKGLAGEQF